MAVYYLLQIYLSSKCLGKKCLTRMPLREERVISPMKMAHQSLLAQLTQLKYLLLSVHSTIQAQQEKGEKLL